ITKLSAATNEIVDQPRGGVRKDSRGPMLLQTTDLNEKCRRLQPTTHNPPPTTHNLLFNLDHEIIELLPRFRQRLVRRLRRNVQDVAGRNLLLRAAFDRGSADLARRSRLAVLNLAADDQPCCPGLHDKDVRFALVILGFAWTFPVRS